MTIKADDRAPLGSRGFGGAHRLGLVPSRSGDRSDHFPAIEKKHGKPVSHWLAQLGRLKDAKYADQIAFLRETHGFSQAHANAVVMHFRGSTTSQRFTSPEQYFTSLDATKAATAREIFAAIMSAHPDLELVVAWNQPMLRVDGKYVFGLSAAKNHLLVNPFSKDALAVCADKLAGYEVSTHTVRLPVDWKVNASLLKSLVRVRLAEIRG